MITWIRGAARGWSELLREAPPELVHVRGDGWIVARSGEATCGLQLGATGSDLSIRLPYFTGAHELALAERLVPQIANAVERDLEIAGHVVPAAMYGQALEQIAPQLIDLAMAEIPKLLASPNTVFNVEGWRRPYLLGEVTLNHLLRTFPHHELLERLLGVIAAMQAISDDKLAPIRELVRDGRASAVATWDVGTERLIPPCSELVIRAGDVSWCVSHARLPDVLRPHAVRLDDAHWLALPPPAESIPALMARAKAAGRATTP